MFEENKIWLKWSRYLGFYFVFSIIGSFLLTGTLYSFHFSISPIPPIEEYIFSSPTKVVESLALGCPVIANEEIIDQKEIINDSGGGICLPYNEDEFVSNLLELSKNKIKLKAMGLNGSKFVSKNRTYNELTKRIINYINT